MLDNLLTNASACRYDNSAPDLSPTSELSNLKSATLINGSIIFLTCSSLITPFSEIVKSQDESPYDEREALCSVALLLCISAFTFCFKELSFSAVKINSAIISPPLLY